LYGNGLRIEIWRELVERFKVPKISEFYGSTEGNANIVNLDSTIGACGLLPLSRFIQDRATVAVLKIDKDTGEFLRDKNGLCIRCDPGEQGHLVGIIRDDDAYGYLFFKDRLGDTYRWRGENVSTMEVEGVLQPVKSIQDVAVYGVEVKGREGRAGM
ncbi:UNVERIFIED_CONTAM: Long-chain fatty acid transport protein 1, partial [Eudyptes robustus]